jgi:hypothetical protein
MVKLNIYLVVSIITPIIVRQTNIVMTNSKSTIEILSIETSDFSSTVLVILEQPVKGGGINESKDDNTIYDASIVYEF